MKAIKLIAAAAAALGLLASCQQQEAESLNNQEELVPVSLTASFSTVETKVSYTETTTGGIKLQPAWKVGDEVIGFDGVNNTYTFTVSEVDATTGVATLDGACPASCTLHLIYLCGATKENITDGSLNVSYANQAGTGSADNVYTMPAVMLADGTVTSGSGDFHFSNAGAIIGISAVKGVPNGTTVTKVTVSGDNLSAATIALDGSQKLKLTVAAKTDDAISTAALSGVTVEDADGKLSTPVLIAVPAGAKVSKVTVAAGGKDYSFNLGSAVEFAAGKYPYINGSSGQSFTEDTVPVTGLSFDLSSKEMNVGDEFTATVTVTPAEATGYTVTWTSSDPSVATVDENGKVKAVGEGTATITAKCGDKTATFTVTVAPAGSVPIKAMYHGSDSTTIYWATQNLSISDSGKKSWKGSNSSAVKVPGTTEEVKVGDFFQWAAHAGYCGNDTDADKGLLVYVSFTNAGCGDSDNINVKSGKQFDVASAPYSSGSAFDNTYSYTSNTTLVETDDVAHIILGGKWRMPTSAEFKAMREATYWAWDSTDQGYYVFKPGQGTSGAANGRGTLTTDDKTKALLFFPAAGNCNLGSFGSVGISGYYWYSSLYLDTYFNESACNLYFDNSMVTPSNYYRYYGRSVRPVSE